MTMYTEDAELSIKYKNVEMYNKNKSKAENSCKGR